MTGADAYPAREPHSLDKRYRNRAGESAKAESAQGGESWNPSVQATS